MTCKHALLVLLDDDWPDRAEIVHARLHAAQCPDCSSAYNPAITTPTVRGPHAAASLRIGLLVIALTQLVFAIPWLFGRSAFPDSHVAVSHLTRRRRARPGHRRGRDRHRVATTVRTQHRRSSRSLCSAFRSWPACLINRPARPAPRSRSCTSSSSSWSSDSSPSPPTSPAAQPHTRGPDRECFASSHGHSRSAERVPFRAVAAPADRGPCRSVGRLFELEREGVQLASTSHRSPRPATPRSCTEGKSSPRAAPPATACPVAAASAPRSTTASS